MVKVINISSKTIEVANVNIKPHTGHIFENIPVRDRQQLSAMSAVGIVRAYEGDYSKELKKESPAHQESKVENFNVDKKPTRKSNKKK